MLTTKTSSSLPPINSSSQADDASQPPESAPLPQIPDPDERPGSDVVLYDGHCLFCRRQVKRLHGVDFGRRLSFLSLHDPRVAERYPDLTHEQLMEQMHLVDTTGRRHAGAGVFRYLTRQLPPLWPLAPLLYLPFSLPLWNWLYGQIARRRYLFGGVAPCVNGACQIPRRTG